MSSTVTTTQSYGSRVAGAFKGILIGLALVVFGICILFTNEGRSVKRYKALKQGATDVISVSADQIDPANQGKLIHITGNARTDEILHDKEFPVEVNAIRLTRNVEMYQWIEDTSEETHKKLGGSTETVTTYSYRKGWLSSPIDSSSFYEKEGHSNPPFLYEEVEQSARNVTLGAFSLSDSIIQSIGPEQNYTVSAVGTDADTRQVLEQSEAQESEAKEAENDTDQTSAADAKTDDADGSDGSDGSDAKAEAADKKTEAASEKNDAKTENSDYRIIAGGFYIGQNPNNPAVGDTRVTFAYVPSDVPLSVVSAQTGNSLTPYNTKNGQIELTANGVKSADEMFANAQKVNTILTWLLRLCGAFLIFIGLKMILTPLSVIADVLPFLGTLIGWGIGAVSFVLALIVSLVIIAVAWFYYRPILSGSLLAVAGAFFGWMIVKSRAAGKRKALAAKGQ